MALDRYQRRGITLERTQPLDFAATREAISFSKDLSARLDKISDIAFEQLKTKAEREGKLYGVQNRPTLEQVQDAIRTKTPRESLEALYEPGDTVFSASARDAQGALLQQDLLHDITLKFQLIDQSIKNEDDIDLDELLVDINANIEGYANVIDQIDPERGIKFRAAASTVGSQTVDAAIKMIDKKNGLIKEQKIQDQLIASKDYITRTVASKLDPLSTKLLITERKENFYELARQRPETMSKNIADFDKAVKESVISEVANDLILSDNLSKFYKGDMGDWDVVLRSEALDDADSINKIIKLATDRIDQKLTTAKKLRDTARETRHEEFIELYDRYDRKELSGEDFKIALKKLNYPLSKELIKEIDEDKTSSMMQDDVFNDLALRVQVGEMSYDEIDAKAYVGEITHMQGVELKKQWRQVNKTFTQGNNVINNTFKMMDEREVLLLKLDDPRRILIAAARNQLAKEAEIALAKGESFNQTIVGERIAQEVLQAYAKDAMPAQEKYIMNILDQTKMVYNRDAFMNMSDEELAKIVTKKGNKLGKETILLLKKRRNNLRKLNQGLVLSAEEY